MAADRFERLGEQTPAVDIDLLDDPLQRVLGRGEVLELGRQGLESVLELFQLFEGFEIHIAEVVDLAAEFLDFLLHLLALMLLFFRGFVFKLGQLDLVVLAETIGKGRSFEADLVGFELFAVDSLLELLGLLAGVLRLGFQGGSILLNALAALHQGEGLPLEIFLAEVQLGDLRLGLQDPAS